MLIRPETPADHSAITRLTLQAFTDHPHHAPGQAPTEHLIIDRLRELGALALSLVAEADGRVVGQISFSTVLIDGQDIGWYGLGPVAVLPEQQGQGTGSALIRQGLADMRARGAQGVVLLGDPAYYRRFGFQAWPQLCYPGVPAEYFMALAFNGQVPPGTVTYHSAFA